DLVQALGMQTAVIPPLPGIASAMGMLDAPIRHDFPEPVQADNSSGLDPRASSSDPPHNQAHEQLSTDDFDSMRLVDARSGSQRYVLTIPYLCGADEQRAAFDGAHEERYGFQDPDAEMEIVVARVVATIGLPIPPQQEIAGGDDSSLTPKEHRPVYIDGEWTDTPIYDRDDLPAGAELQGPAILDQFDTTTYIRPDQTCHCDEFGFLHLSKIGK